MGFWSSAGFFSIIIYEALKKSTILNFSLPKIFLFSTGTEAEEPLAELSWMRPPGVELHTVVTLWSPRCWGTRLLSTFQPTCHRAGICRFKRTSNTPKSEPCINVERRLQHHLHSAGRHFHLVCELWARNGSLWGMRMIWAEEGNEEEEKIEYGLF